MADGAAKSGKTATTQQWILLGVLVSLVGIPTLGVADVEALARSEQQGALANSLGRLDRGIDDRLRLWSSGWQGAAPRLVVGVGPGEAINYAVNLQGVPNSLHNDLLAYLVERGVLGLLGFLTLHWALLGWSGRLPEGFSPVSTLPEAGWRDEAAKGAASTSVTLGGRTSLTQERRM